MSIAELPKVIVSHIFTYIIYCEDDHKNLRNVCKTWRKIYDKLVPFWLVPPKFKDMNTIMNQLGITERDILREDTYHIFTPIYYKYLIYVKKGLKYWDGNEVILIDERDIKYDCASRYKRLILYATYDANEFIIHDIKTKHTKILSRDELIKLNNDIMYYDYMHAIYVHDEKLILIYGSQYDGSRSIYLWDIKYDDEHSFELVHRTRENVEPLSEQSNIESHQVLWDDLYGSIHNKDGLQYWDGKKAIMIDERKIKYDCAILYAGKIIIYSTNDGEDIIIHDMETKYKKVFSHTEIFNKYRPEYVRSIFVHENKIMIICGIIDDHSTKMYLCDIYI
jgi:hypothetical protein